MGSRNDMGSDAHRDWASRIGRLLRMPERDAVRSLTHRTSDGIEIAPLYMRDDLRKRDMLSVGALPLREGVWRVAHPCSRGDAGQANQEIRHAIACGADSLDLTFRGWDGDVGIGAYHMDDMAVLFADIDLSRIALFVRPGVRSLEVACLIDAYCDKEGITPCAESSYAVSSPDSLCYFARSDALRDAFTGALRHFGSGRGRICIDMPRFMHECGASPAQELAIGLAVGRDHLVLMQEMGDGSDGDLGMMAHCVFHFGVDGDCFMTIAKLRAMRLLWSLLSDYCGISCPSIRVMSHIGRRSLSSRHIELNLARITHGIFASSVGGADVISAPAYDGIDGTGSVAGGRLSLNAHHILRDECFLGRNFDPSSGSYYIESLTRDLASKAWDIFTEMFGKPGSVWDRFDDFRSLVKETSVRRDHSEGIRPLVGMSVFADIGDKASLGSADSDKDIAYDVYVSDVPPAEQYGALRERSLSFPSRAPRLSLNGDIVRPSPPILPFYRDDGLLCALRARADCYFRAHGSYPRIFSAYSGETSEFLSAYHWLRQFFSAGGIDVPFHEGFSDPDSLLSAWREDGSRLVVLYSGAYVTDSLCGSLRVSGAAAIWLYGTCEAEDGAGAPFADRVLHEKCSMISTLKEAHDLLGSSA